MKLFTKTLLFFIGVILFESVLAIFLITNVLERSNREDAWRELEAEASIVYENFNAWKRNIWKHLIEVQGDEVLGRILSGGPEPDGTARGERAAVAARLQQMFLRSGYDVLLLATGTARPEDRMSDVPARPGVSVPTEGREMASGRPAFFSVTGADLRFGEQQGLAVEHAHPAVRVRMIGDTAAFVGAVRLPAGAGGGYDVFLLRRVDDAFCNGLTLNRGSHAALYRNHRHLAGAWRPESFAERLARLAMSTSYGEIYEFPCGGGESCNVAVHRVPNFSGEERGEALHLVTFLSNAPYRQRILIVSRIVLLVSAASAFLTILLSLYLTSHITQPVRRLLAAMRRIQEGDFSPSLKGPARGGNGGAPRDEMGQLLLGFNGMAENLRRDKVAMASFISEITLLKEFNEKIIESIQAGILILSRDGTIQKSNRAFLESFGLEGRPIVGRTVTDLRLEIVDRTVLGAIRRTGRRLEESLTAVRRSKAGRVYEIKLYPLSSGAAAPGSSRADGGCAGAPGAGPEGEPGGCVLTVEDISRKVEMEQKIFQAEKLSSLSMLSAGVAHEINNPLGSIMTNVQNLIEEARDGDTRGALKLIEGETRRIARIVRELLHFASTGAQSPAGTDVNGIVGQAITLIGYSLGRESRVAIQAALAEGLPPAAIGEDELKQVIINLLTNSIQAIRDHGRITVRTAGERRGRAIRISVADTGAGIPAEALPHIFDPFFTTKRDGGGTGLGLSITYGILKKARGSIRVASRIGRGTRMLIRLPARQPVETKAEREEP